MSKIDKKFDYNIARLRIAACILVIMVHITHAYLYQNGVMDLKKFPVLIVLNSIARLGVPLFFMISGLLCLKKSYTLEKVRSKIIHYVYVLVIWSIIFFVWNGWYLQEDQCLNPIYYVFEPMKNHLWYLYVLIGLYISYPLANIMIKHMNRSMENYFLLLWLLLAGVGNLLTLLMDLKGYNVSLEYKVPILQGTYWLGYYVAGYIIYKRKEDIKDKVPNWALIIAFLLSISCISVLTYADSIINGGFKVRFLTYGELFLMIASIAIFILNYKIKETRFPILNTLGSYTFGIYLVHPMFVDIAKDYIHFPYSIVYIFIFLILILIPSTLITIGIMKLPKIKKIVT